MIKIIKKTENPLFKRTEITAEVSMPITPSNSEIEKMLSDELKTGLDNIKIKKIAGKFGSNTFTISANIYSTKEDKESIEPKAKEKKS